MTTIEREMTYTVSYRNPYYGPRPEGITPEVALRLAELHVKRYTDMLNAGPRYGMGIVVGEVMFLRRVWRSIQDNGGVWGDLTPTERGELVDAWTDEQS